MSESDEYIIDDEEKDNNDLCEMFLLKFKKQCIRLK